MHIAYLFTCLLIPSAKKFVGCNQSHVCTVTLTSSSLENHPDNTSFSGPNMITHCSQVWTIWGMCKKFKFQLPNCFNGNCCRMHTHIVVEQKDISMCHAVHHIVLTFSCNSVETTNKMQPCNRIYYSTARNMLSL